MSTNMMWESARVVATQLVREPVKDAVREALREETVTVRSAGSDTDTGGQKERGTSTASSDQRDQSSGGGGRSALSWIVALIAIAGVTYLARRRMSSSGSTWSEPSPGAVAEDDAESGYVSEGEMQTVETAEESDG